MKVLGNSRSVATILTLAIGLAASPAWAQIAPTSGPIPTPPPNAAPAKPATKPADAKPAAKPTDAKPAAKPADAKPAAKPDAKALFAAGEKKFKANDFAGALDDFEASNAAKPAPATQRYIALSHDNLQHYPEAVAAFEKFIAEATAKEKAQADEAQKRIDAIKALPGKVHVVATPGSAIVTIDPPPAATAEASATTPAPSAPAAVGTAPAPAERQADFELAPGRHTLRVTADGYEPTDKEVEITYASKQDVRVDLVKKAEPPPPPPPPVVAEAPAPPVEAPAPPPAEPRSKIPAFVTGGIAIVAAGIGTGFGISALSQQSDFDKNPTTGTADTGENNALIADMMFGVAITFGVTSAVLFLSGDDPAPATAKAKPVKAVAKKSVTVVPTPYVTQSGGGAGLNVRF